MRASELHSRQSQSQSQMATTAAQALEVCSHAIAELYDSVRRVLACCTWIRARGAVGCMLQFDCQVTFSLFSDVGSVSAYCLAKLGRTLCVVKRLCKHCCYRPWSPGPLLWVTNPSPTRVCDRLRTHAAAFPQVRSFLATPNALQNTKE